MFHSLYEKSAQLTQSLFEGILFGGTIEDYYQSIQSKKLLNSGLLTNEKLNQLNQYKPDVFQKIIMVTDQFIPFVEDNSAKISDRKVFFNKIICIAEKDQATFSIILNHLDDISFLISQTDVSSDDLIDSISQKNSIKEVLSSLKEFVITLHYEKIINAPQLVTILNNIDLFSILSLKDINLCKIVFSNYSEFERTVTMIENIFCSSNYHAYNWLINTAQTHPDFVTKLLKHRDVIEQLTSEKMESKRVHGTYNTSLYMNVKFTPIPLKNMLSLAESYPEQFQLVIDNSEAIFKLTEEVSEKKIYFITSHPSFFGYIGEEKSETNTRKKIVTMDELLTLAKNNLAIFKIIISNYKAVIALAQNQETEEHNKNLMKSNTTKIQNITSFDKLTQLRPAVLKEVLKNQEQIKNESTSTTTISKTRYCVENTTTQITYNDTFFKRFADKVSQETKAESPSLSMTN